MNRLIFTSDFRTQLVRGLSNKEMKFQNKGAVPVQIAPVLISQPHNQNQSISQPINQNQFIDLSLNFAAKRRTARRFHMCVRVCLCVCIDVYMCVYAYKMEYIHKI